MDELRDRIAEAIRQTAHASYMDLHHEKGTQFDEPEKLAQSVIDALGLHHIEGTDGEWRVVSAWQETSRPF